MTAIRFYDIFVAVRKAYAKASGKFFADTGNIQEKQFINYRFNYVDVYYLYLCLKKASYVLSHLFEEFYCD